MTNKNAEFLAAIDTAARNEILASIAKHYGISAQEAHTAVVEESAEHLLEYMVEPQRTAASVLMQRHGMR